MPPLGTLWEFCAIGGASIVDCQTLTRIYKTLKYTMSGRGTNRYGPYVVDLKIMKANNVMTKSLTTNGSLCEDGCASEDCSVSDLEADDVEVLTDAILKMKLVKSGLLELFSFSEQDNVHQLLGRTASEQEEQSVQEAERVSTTTAYRKTIAGFLNRLRRYEGAAVPLLCCLSNLFPTSAAENPVRPQNDDTVNVLLLCDAASTR